MLNMSKDNELEELDRLDAKYMFLTDTLGWAKGLENKEEHEPKAEDKPSHDKCRTGMLTAYMFIMEQMRWQTGPKIIQRER